MKNQKVAVAMKEIETRNNVIEQMKEQEEKKMSENAIPTVEMSEARKNLIATVKSACKELDSTRANKDKATWKKGLEVSEAVTVALDNLNENMKEEVYDNALKDVNPVASICKAATWSKWYVKTNKKDNVTSMESRATRIDLLNFLEYAGDTVKDSVKIVTAINDTAKKLAAYVLASIKNDKSVSVTESKKALENLFRLINIDGVHGRSIDVRFIAFVAARARKLGELAEISAKTIVPYIMDVVTVQLRGVEYKFEEKEESEKA